VVLTEQQPPGRSLRIIIGQPEARAIQAARDGSVATRASTWDLFVGVVGLLGGRIDAGVITSVEQERHYFAVLEIEHDAQRRVVACRPSDAVALALRSFNAGLYAEESVLDEAGVLPDGTKPGRVSPPTEEEAAAAARQMDLSEREAALAARERAVAEREAALGRQIGSAAEPEPLNDPAPEGGVSPTSSASGPGPS
jgi:bifunctional DNase/RNase